MVNQRVLRSQRLAWLEGLRLFAVVLLLLYHAQLRFTNYAYTPQPTGLVDNVRQLALVFEGAADWGGSWLHLLAIPTWFGFQFVDVFVLISGFSLVLSLKGKSLVGIGFIKRRLLRVLRPFWTVAWLAYPVLWAIAIATKTDAPSVWHMFAGVTFPLLFDYRGELLLYTNVAWWFVPLIISFGLVFPVLWYFLRRWGARNLLVVTLVLTIAYRTLAVYKFGGHPTYVMWDTPANWQPFLSFFAKLSTFVIGMVVGQAYVWGNGPVFWRSRRALGIGIPLYGVGFVCQFYQWGWIFADLLLPIGLTLCCMVVFRALAQMRWCEVLMLRLGAYSYSYFLIHGFVVDHTMKLVVHNDALVYAMLLPVMVFGTLVLAALADYASPMFQRIVIGLWRDLDYVLSRVPAARRRLWNPQVGDAVRYQGQGGWSILKVEKLLDEREFFLCQVSDGQRSLWVNEDDLEPCGDTLRRGNAGINSTLF